MKELLKIIPKKLYIITIILTVIYSIADYGDSFAFAYFGTSPLTLEKVVYIIIIIAIAYTVRAITSNFSNYIDNINSIKTENAIKKYYFNKLQSMSMEQVANTHTGYIQNLISNVSTDFFDLFWDFTVSVIPLIIGGTTMFIMLCKQSVITGIICIIISILAVIVKYKMIKNRQKYQEKSNEAEAKYNATFIDFIQNIVTVRKLNIGKFCERKITKNSEEYLKTSKINSEKRSITNITFNMFMNLLSIVCLISTMYIIKSGQDGLPYLLFYISAMGNLRINLNSIVLLIDSIEEFNTEKKQLESYFKGCKEIKIINNFEKVKLNNVIFSYTKESTKIKIPEFILEKGNKISIMGESGQGKTTVMNILAGLYPIEQGELRINNQVYKDTRLDLVFVSQEVDLFDLSIRDNLCLGKNISDETIFELLENAGLMEWYKELPDGLDTMVGERGIKLSAGQKQRLNLIRGILINKELYFFDEPTSNLDSASEEKIVNMIEKYLKDKTYIIVTHKPRLKDLCNKHYVFENHMMKEIINTYN